MNPVLSALEDRKRTAGDLPAIRFVGAQPRAAVTWSAYCEAVSRYVRALTAAGVRPGGVVALRLPTSARLFALRLALTQVGATAMILSPRLRQSELAAAIRGCGVQLYLGEGAAEGIARAMSVDALEALAAAVLPSSEPPTLSPIREAPEILIFSAGRGGGPRKRVALSSENLLFASQSLVSAFSLSDRDLILSHLPPSRLSEQLFSIHCALLSGAQVCVSEEGFPVGEAIRASRPTVLFGPPDFWRGLKAEALLQAQALPDKVRGRLERAMAVARERNAAELAGRKISTLNELEYRGYLQTVLLPLKALIGLDRCRVAISSGSSLGEPLFQFFSGLDLQIREVYGQAEVSGLSACNVPGESRPGSVGRPLLGVEVRISDDGEIWLRSSGLGSGEWRPRDEWLATGDLGRLDDEGYLYLDGRKRI